MTVHEPLKRQKGAVVTVSGARLAFIDVSTTNVNLGVLPPPRNLTSTCRAEAKWGDAFYSCTCVTSNHDEASMKYFKATNLVDKCAIWTSPRHHHTHLVIKAPSLFRRQIERTT